MIQDLHRYLMEYGIRPSLQRLAIMEYLVTHPTHPTADEIHTALSPSMPTLSKTTVYNTLKLLAAHRAILLLDIDERNSRFDGDVSPHAHFRCRNCGAVYDLPLAVDPEALEERSASRSRRSAGLLQRLLRAVPEKIELVGKMK